MEFIDLNNNWKYCSRIESTDDMVILPALEVVNLPVDLLLCKRRDYFAPLGESNSYYNASCATFYNELPKLQNFERLYLEISGLSGIADIYINNIFAANVASAAPYMLDITDFYIPSIQNSIKLSVTASPQSGKYTGLGISGGIKLIVRRDKLAVSPYGIQVITTALSEQAHLNIKVTLENSSSVKKQATLEVLLYNARSKRVTRRIKHVMIKANSSKLFEFKARLTRHYVYTAADPYMYSACVNVMTDDLLTALDSASTSFGICNSALTNKGLAINGKLTKLKGAVMSHDNGILGMVSLPDAELYKLSRIKKLGYNAVRYIGCPTDACLNALDKLGLYALIDIFDVWQEGKFPLDGHVNFLANWRSDMICTLLKARNHPSVIMYSLGNNISECYNRGGGAALATELATLLKQFDGSRVITANASELVPLRQELAAVAKIESSQDYKTAALSLGREKDLFKKQTSEFFKAVDVAGYSNLHSRYANDKSISGRMIVGLASAPNCVFDALDETDKNSNVIGDFKASGADYLGAATGGGELSNAQLSFVKPHSSFCGDLDIIYSSKPQAYYRQILMGDRSVSLITVADPDSITANGVSAPVLKNWWNWQRFLGKAVEIQVFSGGEVVALYLNDKLIGRKLAGKENKNIATFKTEYYPGKLEAVSFHKGFECSRTVLQTEGEPRAIKLKTSTKSVSVGGISFIQVDICDKEGRLTNPECNIEVIITGEGSVVCLGNANPTSEYASGNVCGVYEGKALVAVMGKAEGKITVKVVSEGLLCGKTIIKVKPTM